MTEKEKKDLLEAEYNLMKKEQETMKNVYAQELKEQEEVIAAMEGSKE